MILEAKRTKIIRTGDRFLPRAQNYEVILWTWNKPTAWLVPGIESRKMLRRRSNTETGSQTLMILECVARTKSLVICVRFLPRAQNYFCNLQKIFYCLNFVFLGLTKLSYPKQNYLVKTLTSKIRAKDSISPTREKVGVPK